MTCDEAEILIHALIDNELDASHAREVEAHVATCARCTAQLASYRQMREMMNKPELRFVAPAGLRRRLDEMLPKPAPATLAAASNVTPLASRRSVLRGFALGSAVSALAATLLVAVVTRHDDQQLIESEIVSSHLRSLQPGHLIDVVSSDQHTVKPWFNGKLDVSPPVINLTAQGFTLIGGRLDYVDARAIGAVVYKRRAHIINLFVAQTSSTAHKPARMENIQGFNVRSWSDRGMNFWAVSDIGPDELAEFGEKFEATARNSKEG